ncbi:MAG: cyclase family protein [Planctomycetota bacterium]|nr:cyclase family protein [Planctomycetota bacterium]
MACSHRFPLLVVAVVVYSILCSTVTSQQTKTTFVDCSLVVAPNYPATWPSYPFPKFNLLHQLKIGPASAYNIDAVIIDGNTGTQLDVPPHSVARPDLNRPKSGPLGLHFTDKIEPWQFGGEACVIDVRELLNQAPKGTSPLVKKEHVQRFEKQNRELRFGDVVLFRSDYSDRYYKPFPQGNRYLNDILDKKAPGYPDPDPDCMEFLANRQVMTLGTDSASMGPLPTLAEPTHYAGLKHGMIWTEGATNLGKLPSTGAFYCMMGPRHKDGPYGEGRAFAIIGGDLPKRLIESSKNRRAIDLSPTLQVGLPLTHPGGLTGRHRQVYLRINFAYSDYLDLWHHTHFMDSMAGTHLVPPSFALPPDDKPVQYAPQVRGWLEDYEKKFGPRGSSTLTTEKIPLSWTCGEARVINVTHLTGTVDPKQFPASPLITPDYIQNHEKNHGKLNPGEIIIFRTDHVEKKLKPKPEDTQLWLDPLTGKTEGWAVPTPETIFYLKSKGIRCIATDAPDLGGVDPKRALMNYWALGSSNMVGVEFLSNTAAIPSSGGYFLFAPVKIQGCHGGPGRAIVLY